MEYLRPICMQCLLCLLILCPHGQATYAAQLSTTATSILPNQPVRQFKLLHDNADGRIEQVKVTGQSFNQAIRASTLKQPQKARELQMICPIWQSVQKNDVLYASFWMRTISSEDDTGEGKCLLLFEKVGSPWNRSVQLPISVGKQWQQYNIAFRCGDDYAPLKAQMIFRIGYKPQVIEIADVQLLNYRDTVQVDDLPGIKLSYEGREPDAPWREEAAKRIETYRKGSINLTVTDTQGKPLAGVPVKLQMTRLAFDLGTAVKARYLAGDDVNSRKMQDIIKELFNCVVFENDLKWTSYSPKNHAMISEALDYCQQHQLKVRGHTMVWGSWSHVSPKLRAMANDTTGLSEAIANRITSIGSTYAGRLYEWDVINEPNNHHDLMDVLGYDAMSQWFKLAHAADPNAMLYLNETGVPVGGPDADIYNVLEGHVQRLLRTGAPIHGIGMQGHVGWSMNSPEALWQIFDRFAKLGMPIKITEFDTGVTDEALSADYYRDFYTACFAHPSINGILIWGIWESNKLNRPESAIYRPDWSPKPAALALEKLIGQWKTNIDAMTDAQGQLSVKGYCGSYTLQVGDNAASIKKTFELKREGFSDNIQLTKLK